MELDEKRVNNWLTKFNLYPSQQIHASGHAAGNHILRMIKAIKPKMLIPIHTEHPEKFKGSNPNIKLVEYGEEYKF